MDHDHNFKNLILDYPRQALRFFAPEEAEALDPAVRITPVRQEQLKERLGDRFRELDVPLLVEWPDGRREALLFVIEEETRPRRFSIHRLAHYCLDLAELFQTDRVVPVVIFLHQGDYPEQLRLGGDRHVYLRFKYLVSDLPRMPAERYRDSDNIVARLNLPNMRHSSANRVEIYADAVRGLLTLEPDGDRQSKYIDFIDIYADLDDNELQAYQRNYLREVENMSGLAQALRREGLEKGIEQGLEQGLEQGVQKGLEQGVRQGVRQGEAEALLKLLNLKFGDVPDAVRRQVESADRGTLSSWLERVLTAGSVDEVVR